MVWVCGGRGEELASAIRSSERPTAVMSASMGCPTITSIAVITSSYFRGANCATPLKLATPPLPAPDPENVAVATPVAGVCGPPAAVVGVEFGGRNDARPARPAEDEKEQAPAAPACQFSIQDSNFFRK